MSSSSHDDNKFDNDGDGFGSLNGRSPTEAARGGGKLAGIHTRQDFSDLDDNASPLRPRYVHVPRFAAGSAEATEYLRELYYDAISYHRPTLDAVAAFAGADRLMFGTDHPFFSPLEGKDDAATRWASVDLNYAAMDHRDAATRDGVRYANARRILNLYE